MPPSTPSTRNTALAAVALLSACTHPTPTTIDPTKIAQVQVGRSTRADVFTTLGRPARSERSTTGERWVYEATPPTQGSNQFVGGVGTAAGILGTVVPFVGLVGPGLSLATAATNTQPPDPAATLAIDFTPDGLVRDCLYTSAAIPPGLPGAPMLPPPGCTPPQTSPSPPGRGPG